MLTTYPHLFAALSRSWLEAGATQFEIWAAPGRSGNGMEESASVGDAEESMLARWPDHSPPHLPTLTAVVQSDRDRPRLGELRVAGVGGAAMHAHLAADAALIATLAHLELEQESMVAELINTQDQLLAVYDLNRSDCYQSYYVDIEQLLHCLIHEIVPLLQSENGLIILQEASHPESVCYHAALDTSTADYLLALLRETSGGSELIVTRNMGGVDLPQGVDNLLFVCIQVHPAMRVGLGVWNKAEGFASPDLKLVQAIAEQAAARIENFLLYQETLLQAKLQTEMHMARQVQFRLLPQQLPVIEGVEMYADWRPALQASGDFYDYLVRPDRPCIFTVGDVSGKGMPAALLTVEAITEIRSQARILFEPTPSDIMRSLNEALYADFEHAEMFATVFIGEYEPTCRQLRYTNAGQSPVIYCPSDAPPRMLKADGPPIGVLPRIAYQNNVLTLNPGDMLLVGTDGFNETFNAEGAMFGYQRILDFLDTSRHLSAQAIVTGLFDAVTRFAGRPESEYSRDDDQAIIVLKGTGSAVESCAVRNTHLRMDIPAEPHYLDILHSTVSAMLARQEGLEQTETLAHEIHLAVHELCANIIEHAYQHQPGTIAITLTLASLPPRMIVETCDTGVPCNPAVVPEPDMLAEGGRGLSMIRTLMDEITYQASNDMVWQSVQGQPWQQIQKPHAQPGYNYWHLVKIL
jgi:sigma-B regulation protein RsbU (phosphoserine phosphatase)